MNPDDCVARRAAPRADPWTLVIDGAAADELVDTTGYDPHREVVADGVSRAVAVTLDALVDL
jgi:hypothetical protein